MKGLYNFFWPYDLMKIKENCKEDDKECMERYREISRYKTDSVLENLFVRYNQMKIVESSIYKVHSDDNAYEVNCKMEFWNKGRGARPESPRKFELRLTKYGSDWKISGFKYESFWETIF